MSRYGGGADGENFSNPSSLRKSIKKVLDEKKTYTQQLADSSRDEKKKIPSFSTIAHQQFRGHDSSIIVGNNKEDDINQIGKTYLQHNRSQKNLEPSLMTFLNLLRASTSKEKDVSNITGVSNPLPATKKKHLNNAAAVNHSMA